jgi:hypothetical protein
MADKHPPEVFLPYVEYLNHRGIVPAVVAGQAVNLWAGNFVEWDARFSSLPVKLSQLLPFTSGDMELLGEATGALRDHPRVVGEEPNSDPFSKAWSPEETTFYLESAEHGQVKIQTMKSILGLRPGDLSKRAIEMAKDRARFFLPDPVTLLTAKMHNLDEIKDQEKRQDEKHVKIMILCTRAFIGEGIQNRVEGRKLLNVIDRLHRQVASPMARRLKAKHNNLDFSDALPADLMPQSADPKIQRFMAEGFPRMAEFHPDPEIKKMQAQLASAQGVTPSGAPSDEELNSIQDELKRAQEKTKQNPDNEGPETELPPL